ncbi:flagellar hook-basal body complex protein [Cellvibrio japonicus]|uniref:Flagellar hook protein FlgE n=1 Tax=Cellvibrio japonicus (strain Ueda107) TaxID=498211 RepID=B3PGS5_CELJU|nr:flagellar hook-basal body complex protein [Cellvibrio japonicus]ACE82629.1 flagellar hook protein FlgE [Cellvibrio japonicus Ueda107]QEI12420.1 flagellar hook-basal body complex protein [Cellvibrio japonicus]QEI15993.1 flagellar hook-basal body complex protein [Cellvibrio japonicus]QEI19572.1 flagellar hook-basal body complex protein [Cellvibrio japonicus]
MSFNTALSGIRAANTDLQVTGNNIANASTIGFKSSRAEFGDVYTSTLLGGGANTPGSGVTIQNIRQQFTQGNLKFTQNELDLSINGEGFFVVEKNGERLFTRAGTFGLDKNGYIVNGTGALLQGFVADANGNISGVLSDLRVDVSSQAPRQTTAVDASFNLNANESVLETTGQRFSSNGSGVNEAQQGAKTATTSTLNVGAVSLAPSGSITFSPSNTTTFTLYRTDPVTLATTSSTIQLNSGSAASTSALANLINSANFDSPSPVNVEAYADATTGELRFRDLATGVASIIAVEVNPASDANPLTTALNGAATSVGVAHPTAFQAGVPEVTNNYGSHTLVIRNPGGTDVTYISEYGSSADKTASELNALAGVSATANTTATLIGSSFSNNGSFRLNGVNLTSTGTPDMTALRDEINALSTSTLFGISAQLDDAGNLQITSATGRDLDFSFDVGGGVAQVQGAQGPAQTVNNATEKVKIGGVVTVTLQEGYSINSSQPTVPVYGGSLYGSINVPNFFTPVPINAFDPNDQKTYNHATSTTVYDSLGNPHVMRQFFVKQAYDPADPSTSPNHWVMYVQIDGQNVGDPNPSLPSPQNTQPTMASFNVHFYPDGSLNPFATDTMLISNWTPLGTDGQPVGALGPLNVLQGGGVPVVEPPTSSNFEVDLAGSTQFGSVFAVESLDQNGYATGRLAGLDISTTGIVFARFTNGEAQILGQVALANFASVDNLKPTGDTMWTQTFESGEAVIGAPGSAQLGNITAGAVEESNVDLSEQLVNLIIAQRNYQANAKTIETANATTQTIINLR